MSAARAAGVLALLAGLYAVTVVHAAGQTLLAVVLLVLLALAAYTYGSARTQALRWLFPGIAAALVFVVFPMLYTVGIAFTNRSSGNLLDHDEARARLLAETRVVEGTQRGFTLHDAGGGRLRVALPATGGAPALRSAPVASDKPMPRVTLSADDGTPAGEVLPMAERVRHLAVLRTLVLVAPDGAEWRLLSLREMAQLQPLYAALPDGSLRDTLSGRVYRADTMHGWYASADGERLPPGFVVNVGLRHFARVFTDAAFRAPFVGVFAWTVAFSALTVLGAAALGLLLATLLQWDELKGRGVYRMVLFLPYAVPGFISILVFKGLFNQNLGEINLILHGLFGIRPAWFSDPMLARTMLLLVNVWLGFPYMMVLCAGLIQSIPGDLHEASAVLGAGPFTHFRRVTLPLIARPLTPLLIAAFAFNFNNFVLVSLLTGGRPDQVDAALPAGTTDILVSYTWRIAFQDGGQQYGLAAAISTVIFGIVAAITLVQMRATRAAEAGRRGA